MRAPLFKALTRPVSFMGLPMTYVAMLMVVSIGGFIASGSFVYFFASAIIGYSALRLLAAYDPRLFDVFFTIIRVTPMTAQQMKGENIRYEP